MTQPISGLGNLQSYKLPLTSAQFAGNSAGNEVQSFQNLLLGSLKNTSELGASAEKAIETSLSGGDITQVEVFSAVKKADLALRMTLQIRNKIFEGLEEIKRMQM